MKKAFSVVLTLAMVVLLLVPADAMAATELEQAKVTSFTRDSKSSIVLAWDKVYGAKGYQVCMKTNGGKYKKIATTAKKKYKVTGLEIGKSYCFKIRAYSFSKGKEVYGRYSTVIRKKMKTYEYLVDVAEPYYKNRYEEYTGANFMSISGKKYYNGFLCEKCADDVVAIWNLSDKYSKITFSYGNQDMDPVFSTNKPGGCDVIYKGDDEILKKISVAPYDLAKTCKIDIKGIHKFSIEIAGIDVSIYDYFAMGNVKVYY